MRNALILLFVSCMGMCYVADDRAEHRDFRYRPSDVPNDMDAMSDAERQLYSVHQARYERRSNFERDLAVPPEAEPSPRK